jgi:glutathione synthase/RimK-type ligase-like ATP-grasp enzyme
MKPIVVVDTPRLWPLDIPTVEVVSARSYLFDPEWSSRRGVRVFNLCRSYRYQSTGYYVSLLATARGHRPVPNVTTIQDLKATEIVRIRSSDIESLIQQSMSTIKSDDFVLSIYFGQNLAKRHDRLAARIFGLFEAPLLRAVFRRENDRWELSTVRTIATDDIPPEHNDFVISVAREYFAKRYRPPPRGKPPARYDLAILFDPRDPEPPSGDRAITKFIRAAEAVGMRAETVGKSSYARLAEFDALFIRETTNVNHHTYRFARRAAAEGLVVIDDPESILRCTNKVYLAELLHRQGVPTPATLVLHRGNLHEAERVLGMPIVLKEPDSSFSLGVKKVETPIQLREEAERMLQSSELIIGQAFTPTELDWRVGVLGGQPLWVCKYFMAQNHWQIRRSLDHGRLRYGRVEAVPVSEAPRSVVRTALAACKPIGHGLYGVDLKQIGRRVYVIEVNDNPTIEAGDEDAVLGDQLYQRIMQHFVDRLDEQHAASNGHDHAPDPTRATHDSIHP